MYSLPNDLGHQRMGISISRRVGTAPRRNRIKRLLREAFRLSPIVLPRGYDLVIVVRPHAPLEFSEYQKLFAQLVEKSDILLLAKIYKVLLQSDRFADRIPF